MAKTDTAGRRDVAINLRANRRQRHLIDRAAEALGRSRSDFMLDAACRAAESALLDRRVFFLAPQAHDEFLAMLDAPAKPSKALRARMKRRPPWRR
ncbi:MAG: DUF1778 domain-containing protein [Proteobacteria bacterium]|nr:DUF1778 domain-containing protein [Pseudomonadota bacterium]